MECSGSEVLRPLHVRRNVRLSVHVKSWPGDARSGLFQWQMVGHGTAGDQDDLGSPSNYGRRNIARTFARTRAITPGIRMNISSMIAGDHLQVRCMCKTNSHYCERSTLNAGLRYDYYSELDASTDPRLALIYRPARQTALKLIYAQAFRVPNVYELYYSVAPNLPNPKLNPERIRSIELVWEQGMGKRLWMSASGFYNRMNDLIPS